jgi:phosphoribosylanthranilate isomerase
MTLPYKIKPAPGPHKKPSVKVCGLTRPEDIRACLDAGVHYLGVNRHPPSPRYVAGEKLAALLDLIPKGKRVFVDVAPSLEELADADRSGFDIFQIHFDPLSIPRGKIAAWADCVGSDRLWLAPRLAGGVTFPTDLLSCAAAFLIDGYSPESYGGTGKTADWTGVSALKSVHPEKTWLVAGGLNAENIAEAAHASHADILDLNSGIEDAPGLKSVAKLHAALAKLSAGFTPRAPSGTGSAL